MTKRKQKMKFSGTGLGAKQAVKSWARGDTGLGGMAKQAPAHILDIRGSKQVAIT
jgi:hypothetical protein